MARQPCAQDPVKASVMAATVLAIRMARPALSAMSSQSFETSTPNPSKHRPPMHNGPATAERSVEADRRRATMAHLSQEGEGPLAQDCHSGWARPTVRAQDRKRQDDGSRLLANSCSIQNRSRRPARHSYRKRNAAKEQPVNTYNPGERRASSFIPWVTALSLAPGPGMTVNLNTDCSAGLDWNAYPACSISVARRWTIARPNNASASA
jgi:hypothetical protein